MKRLMVGLVVLSLGLFTLGCGSGEKAAPVKKAGTTGTTSTAPSTPGDKAPDKGK